MQARILRIVLAVLAVVATIPVVSAQQCPATVPVEGATPPAPLPLFPSDNWWNADISAAPVDCGSASYIAFINNGGTRRLHPDFGGEASPGSVDIYGMPYAIVDGVAAEAGGDVRLLGRERRRRHGHWPGHSVLSDSVAGRSTQPHWVEGGAAGQRRPADAGRSPPVRSSTARTAISTSSTTSTYNSTQAKWYAGSGAFFDMNTNNRRPDGWTSADAAGLAIFPGLVRYDEAWNGAIADIGHAFRVTVRATNGYVYPASHRAGSTAGALPMGARLRLKNASTASTRRCAPAIRTCARSSARCRSTA